jgi:hypothetical protein
MYLVAAGLLVFVTSPVLAAEFYVAQDPSTKECTIEETKPDGTTMIMIGKASYATKKEAKEARRAAAECPKKPAAPEKPDAQ